MSGRISRQGISGITPQTETTSSPETKQTGSTAEQSSASEQTPKLAKATQDLAASRKNDLDQQAFSLRDSLLKQTATSDRTNQRDLPKTTDLKNLPIDKEKVAGGTSSDYENPILPGLTDVGCGTGTGGMGPPPEPLNLRDHLTVPDPHPSEESKAEERSEAVNSHRGLPKTTDLDSLPIDKGEIDPDKFLEPAEFPTLPTTAEGCNDSTNTIGCETAGALCV